MNCDYRMARVYFPDDLNEFDDYHALLEVENGVYRLDLVDGRVMITSHVEGSHCKARCLRRPDVQAALAEAEEVLEQAIC